MSSVPLTVRGVLHPVAIALATLVLLAAALASAGFDAVLALQALWVGSFGSWYALTSATLVRATPLILTGLAVALAFRAGVWNIGAEGQLLLGGSVFAAIGLAWGVHVGPVALAAGLGMAAVAGAAWAGIAAWLRHRFGVLEVISTIMLNFVALHVVGYLVRGPLQEPLGIYPQSSILPETVRLARIVPGTRLHWGLLLAIIAAGMLWWVLRSTAIGFRVRAAGASPSAAASAGTIDVARTTAGAFLVSGALAGLAGAVEVGGVTFALYESLSPGYGYTAIAVALLAKLHPGWVVVSGILFGALESGATAMQRDAGVPSVVVMVVEAVLILMVLAAGQVRGWSWVRTRIPAGGAPVSYADSAER